MLSGMMSWISCKSLPIIPDTETCFNRDGRYVRCQERSFNVTKKNVGDRITTSVNRNINYIDNWMCVSPEWWAIEAKPKLKEINRLYHDRKN